MLRAGNGAARQRMVFDANRDVRELMAEIVATSADCAVGLAGPGSPSALRARRRARGRS